MATRTFCDHCGNTVQNPTVLSFGPFKQEFGYLKEKEMAIKQAMHDIHHPKYAGAAAGAGSGGGYVQVVSVNAGVGAQKQAPSPTQIKVTDVDLCPACAPIWFERVSRLCRASDPKED